MRVKAPVALLALLFLTLSFIPAPAQAFSLGLEPSTGTVGMDIKIPAFCQYGEGDYYLYWGDDNQLCAQGTVDAKGCTPIFFKVPQTTRGRHTVTLKVGTRTFSRDFTVIGTVSLSVKKGPIGSQVLVQGFGFENQEGGIHITYDGNNVASSIEANRIGSWQYALKVPVSCRGNHPISASGPSTTAQEVGTKPFEVSPTIAVTPANGWVGRVVNISGAGFGNGESSITVLYDDLPVKSGLIADSAGTWQSSFSVPVSSKGTHKLDARGNMTVTEEVPDVTLTIAPGIRVEQTTGKIGEVIRVGDTLLVSGIGFQANEPNVAVTFDGISVVEKITADAQGSWSTQFSVPAISRGDHIVKSSGDATRADDVTPYTVVVTPYLEVNPSGGPIGSSMVLSGNGFSSNQPLAFTYDAKKVDTTASTDYKGNINTAFKPPVSKAGTHVLAVSDVGGARGTVTITIESTPPNIPSLISPKESTIFSLFENKPVDFSWGAVEDPSGVVYTFELSQKLDFSGPVTRRENLEKAVLSLHINERPMAGKYFWRVKAIDLAGNSSDWSKPQSIEFTGFEYLWIAGIALGVLVLAGLIVWRIRAISKKGGWSSESDSDS
jgi:hypothetical protein